LDFLRGNAGGRGIGGGIGVGIMRIDGGWITHIGA
jgi:hypothetical protein